MTVKITQIDEARDATVLRIEGKLAAGDAVMLTWILARLEGGERISIDMSGVTYLDGEVAAIFRRLEENGAGLIGVDFFIRSVIDADSNGNKKGSQCRDCREVGRETGGGDAAGFTSLHRDGENI